MRRTTGFLAVAFAVTFCAPGAQAQFGGLKNRLKKKVEGMAGSKDSASAAKAPAPAGAPAAGAPRRTAGPAYNDRIIEMTPEVLDRFAAALAAERSDRAAAAQALSPAMAQKYQRCTVQVAQSPEGKALYDKITAAMGRSDMDEYQKLAAENAALTLRKCGPNPQSGAYRDSLSKRPVLTAAGTGKFTPEQYALLKERVVPFCKGGAEEADGTTRVKGFGREIYYTYGSGEAAALRPRCGDLSKAIAATM